MGGAIGKYVAVEGVYEQKLIFFDGLSLDKRSTIRGLPVKIEEISRIYLKEEDGVRRQGESKRMML